jgi:type I restriction enzyme, S subunit
MSELPRGWSVVKLRELSSTINYGHTASATDQRVGPRFLRITDIQDDRVDWSTVPFCACDESEKYNLSAGDIVVARTGATTGKSYLIKNIPEPAVFASYLIRIQPNAAVQPPYLSWFMQSPSYWEQITTVSKGTAQPGANASLLGELDIPLAPSGAQRRIVSKIESLTARSRRAKEALDAVPTLLEKFRQSVLAAAFRGDLTADWREKHPDVEPAEVLLKRIRIERRKKWEEAELAKMRAKGKAPGDDRWKAKYEEPAPVDTSELPELPEGWAWTPIADLGADPFAPVQTGPFGAQLHHTEYVDKGTPLIAVGNLTGIGFKQDGLYYITAEKAAQLARYDVHAGDVLFARSGATLGKVCVAPEYVNDWRMSGHILRLRVNKYAINPALVVYALWGAPAVKEQVVSGIRGMTRPGYNTELLERIILPVPPAPEQIQILRRVDEAFRRIDYVEQHLDALAIDTQTLDSSILAKAFRGELVPQDPNDEPASVLLERIRAEAANQEGTAKKRGGKKRS